VLIEFAAYVREPQFDPTSPRQVSFAQWLGARPELHRSGSLTPDFQWTHHKRRLVWSRTIEKHTPIDACLKHARVSADSLPSESGCP